MRLLPLAILIACHPDAPAPEDSGSPPATGDTGPDTIQGACGSIGRYDVTLIGLVVTPGGQPAPGASVHLEERNYDTVVTVYGEGTTDENGRFELFNPQIVGPDDCWGTLVDYHVMVTLAPGAADEAVNDSLFHAVDDGTMSVDISSVPIQLEPVAR